MSTVTPLYLTLLPMRLRSENNLHEHWRIRHKRRKVQRDATYLWLSRWFVVRPVLPLTITLTRVAPLQLDSDNLPGSFKAVQDGVADWLDNAPGKGQDRKPGLTWRYAQRKGKVIEYAVEIAIEQGES